MEYNQFPSSLGYRVKIQNEAEDLAEELSSHPECPHEGLVGVVRAEGPPGRVIMG